jgi:hypothetical protein
MNSEHWIDLTNYREHPTNTSYLVFKFKIKEQQQYFIELLQQQNIYCEFDSEETPNGTLYLVGAKKIHEKQLVKLNNLAIGKYRKPFVGNTFLKWTLVLFFFAVMVIAILGAMLSK